MVCYVTRVTTMVCIGLLGLPLWYVVLLGLPLGM